MKNQIVRGSINLARDRCTKNLQLFSVKIRENETLSNERKAKNERRGENTKPFASK